MKHLSILLLSFSLFSCNKNEEKEEVTRTFEGNLPIVSTVTPTIVPVGTNIVSRVYFELASISGSVIFQDFQINETTIHRFDIRAKAIYKDWNTQIAMPVLMNFDTTSNIKAATPGQYILNYYNSEQLVESDTVLVN